MCPPDTMHALRGERVGFQYLVKDEVPYYRRQRFVVFILIPAVHRARGGTIIRNVAAYWGTYIYKYKLDRGYFYYTIMLIKRKVIVRDYGAFFDYVE